MDIKDVRIFKLEKMASRVKPELYKCSNGAVVNIWLMKVNKEEAISLREDTLYKNLKFRKGNFGYEGIDTDKILCNYQGVLVVEE